MLKTHVDMWRISGSTAFLRRFFPVFRQIFSRMHVFRRKFRPKFRFSTFTDIFQKALENICRNPAVFTKIRVRHRKHTRKSPPRFRFSTSSADRKNALDSASEKWKFSPTPGITPDFRTKRRFLLLLHPPFRSSGNDFQKHSTEIHVFPFGNSRPPEA